MPEVFSVEEKILVKIDNRSPLDHVLLVDGATDISNIGINPADGKYRLFTRCYISGLRAVIRLNQFQRPDFEPLSLGLSETERAEYQLERDLQSEHMELAININKKFGATSLPEPAGYEQQVRLLEAVLVNRGYSESMFLQPFLSDTANYVLPNKYTLSAQSIDRGFGTLQPGSEVIITGNIIYEVTAIQRVFDSVSWRSGKRELTLVPNSNPPLYQGTINFFPITTYFGLTHAEGDSQLFINNTGILGEGLALCPKGAYEQWYSFYGFPLPNSLTFVSSEPATISFMCGGTQY